MTHLSYDDGRKGRRTKSERPIETLGTTQMKAFEMQEPQENLELGRYSGRRAKWSAFMETCSYMECGLNKHRRVTQSGCFPFPPTSISNSDSPWRRHLEDCGAA